MSAGAVANPGIAVKIGAKKIASRNKKPVTTDARPVLAPAPTPAELSTNVVRHTDECSDGIEHINKQE